MRSASYMNIKTSLTAKKSKYKNPNFAEMDKQFGYKDRILIVEAEQTLL